MSRIISAIASFFRFLFGKSKNQQRPETGPDVDQVAEDFYDDLLDAEKKRKT